MTIRAIYQSVRRIIARTIFGERHVPVPSQGLSGPLWRATLASPNPYSDALLLVDPALDIPAKPMSRSERLVDIARRRSALKDQIALAIKQKKPRLALRGQLAKLSHEELKVEAGQ